MKTPSIAGTVSAEMRRLAKVHPLLSPTAGWTRLKGVHAIETELSLTFVTKVHPALGFDRAGSAWLLEDKPELRNEANRALRGLLGTVTRLAGNALKPAGWKLKALDHRNTNAVGMVWSRKGREIALLGYIETRLPDAGWNNVRMRPGASMRKFEPNCYTARAMLVIATPKASQDAVGEVCAALDGTIRKRYRSLKFDTPFDMGIGNTALIFGMPQIHFCKPNHDDKLGASHLSPHHLKLIESLRGKVCFVGFEHGLDRGSAKMSGHTIAAGPNVTLGAKEAWAAMSNLRDGQIRLVAVDDQGRMKWCETFGPGDTVPAATVKRLLASSRCWSQANRLEQEAIYRSTKA